MLFGNSQWVLTSFQSKSLCHFQAKTFESINPIGLHFASSLHLSRILSLLHIMRYAQKMLKAPTVIGSGLLN
jgi:hypothetical protein